MSKEVPLEVKAVSIIRNHYASIADELTELLKEQVPQELKDKNLVEHAEGRKGGYQLTERGIAVFRKMIKAIAEKEQRKVELPPKDKIVSIIAVEQPEEGKCCFCGKDAVLYYQVGGFEKEWGLTCQDCGEAIRQSLGRI